MVKLSRSAFLSMLVASGTFVLTGCGAGTDKNSNYSGAYSSAYSIPELNESGFFRFTVDVKGKLTGTLDNQNGKYREVTGEIKSNGELSADTFNRADNIRGKISGSVSGGSSVSVPGNPPLATPIIGGNFALEENSIRSTGSFRVGDTPPSNGSSGYQGYFNGVYSVPELKQNGDTSFSVDSAGKMTGLLTRSDETGLLTGSLANTGVFTATVAFRRDSVALSGTLIKTTDNSTRGNFNLTQGGKAYAGSFGTAAPTPVNNAFAGSYEGTYSIPEGNEDGSLSFTVDLSGSINGLFTQNNNSPVGTFTGAFTTSGRFNGTVSYNSGTGLAPRPINGTMSNAGSQSSGDFVITIDGVNRSGNFRVTAPPNDSNYRAAYSDAGLFEPAVSFGGAPTSVVLNTNAAEFSVDKQGVIVGSFGLYPVNGRVTNDARITGSLIGADGKRYPFRGIVNKVTWTLSDKSTTPGIKGDLIFSIDGKEYNGFLKATGGDGTTQ